MANEIADFEAELERMEPAWARIAEALHQVPGSWTTSMADLTQEHRRLVREGAWRSGPADFLAVLHRSGHETYHSLLIAWLCRPQAHHGLGDRFLRRLIADCGASNLLDDGADSAVHVTTEDSAGEGRIDILIETERGRLAIENKTWAVEGPGQLEHYYDALNDGSTVFAFLTPRGRRPVSAGETADMWDQVSYRQVAAALRNALDEPNDHPGIAVGVAHSYLDCLETEFP